MPALTAPLTPPEPDYSHTDAYQQEAAETASVRAEVRELTRMMRGGGAS